MGGQIENSAKMFKTQRFVLLIIETVLNVSTYKKTRHLFLIPFKRKENSLNQTINDTYKK